MIVSAVLKTTAGQGCRECRSEGVHPFIKVAQGGPTDKVTFEQRPMGTGSEPRGSLRENRPAEDQHVDRPEAGRR